MLGVSISSIKSNDFYLVVYHNFPADVTPLSSKFNLMGAIVTNIDKLKVSNFTFSWVLL